MFRSGERTEHQASGDSAAGEFSDADNDQGRDESLPKEKAPFMDKDVEEIKVCHDRGKTKDQQGNEHEPLNRVCYVDDVYSHLSSSFSSLFLSSSLLL